MTKPKSPADEITHAQYERGLEMFEALATQAAIATATGMTRHQVAWCVTKGDEAAGMPRWMAVIAERAAERRRTQLTVGQSIAVGAASMIDGAQQIAVSAQSYIKAVMGSHLTHAVRPALLALEAGPGDGETPDAWAARAATLIESMAMPRDVRETLKTMRLLADIETPARTYREVWLNAHMSRHNGLADTLRGFSGKVELGAEAALPAQVTAVERLPGAEQGVADPLDVDPEFKGMTLDEIETFQSTGKLPDRLYTQPGQPTAVTPIGEDPTEDLDIDWDPSA